MFEVVSSGNNDKIGKKNGLNKINICKFQMGQGVRMSKRP